MGMLKINSSKEFKLLDLIDYLKNPQYTVPYQHSLLSNIRYLLWSYLFCFSTVICSGLIILLVDSLLVNYIGIDSIYKQIKASNQSIKHSFGIYTFVIVAFIGPFIEEIIFRLPLNVKRISIAFAITVLTFKFSGGSFFNFSSLDKFDLIRLLCSISIFLLVSRYIPNNLIKNIREKYFNWWFYSIIIIFGLVHISNIKNIDYHLLIIYPIFVMPQMVMGFFIGNIRLQRGFLWGFLLHALINSISFLFS